MLTDPRHRMFDQLLLVKLDQAKITVTYRFSQPDQLSSRNCNRTAAGPLFGYRFS